MDHVSVNTGNWATVSISDKTSYRETLQSLEGARSGVKMFESLAADLPVKFQSDRAILNSNLTASKLCEILNRVLKQSPGPLGLHLWACKVGEYSFMSRNGTLCD